MGTFAWTFSQTFSDESDWEIDGTGVRAPTTEVATHQSLILGFRVDTNALTTTFRELKPNEGQLNILRTDSGGYRVVDRAGGDNTFTLSPPGRRRPLRYEGEYHVRRYEESLVSQEVNEWDVEIEFVPAENRTDSPATTAGYAAEFDGSDDYGVAESVSAIQYDPNTDDHTVSFRLRPDEITSSADQFLFTKITEEADYNASITDAGVLEWIVIPSNGPSSTTTVDLTTLTSAGEWIWVNCEVVHDQGTAVYIDGTQEGSNAETWSTADADSAAPDLYLGGRNFGSDVLDHYDGLITEFQVHDKTLTSSERQTLIDGGDVTDSRLVHYDFDDANSDTTVADSEFGPDLELTGGSVVPVTETDEWGIGTRYGSIATPHVDAEFIGTGREGVERFELLTRLSLDEAHIIEAALARLEGVRTRQVVDGQNVAVDDTDAANTLTITSPVGSEVPDGSYVALAVESERLNDGWQAVRTTVVPPEVSPTPDSGAYGQGTYNVGTYNQ